MQQLKQVADFIVDTFSGFLDTMNDNWFSQIILFLVVIDVVISSILLIRGTK